jgi:allantoicase
MSDPIVVIPPPRVAAHQPFMDLVDLASARVGGAALFATDEFFAGKENLLRAERPIFNDEYTDRGKWMDGWESRRSFGRVPGHTHDACILKLGVPGHVHGVDVDTSWFRGNYPDHAAIDACAIDGDPDVATLVSPETHWHEILPATKLEGHGPNPIALAAPTARVTHLRLRIYPDGGVARFRAYGVVAPAWKRILRLGTAIDLAAIENGGVVVACNDMFFGSRHNLIMPGRATNMGDGWETKRKRVPGFDWVVVKLGARGMIRGVEVDTNWFKGNFPESCALEIIDDPHAALSSISDPSRAWRELLPRTKLRGHTRHFFDEALADAGPATHVRMRIFPDGGISRLRVFGAPIFEHGGAP